MVRRLILKNKLDSAGAEALRISLLEAQGEDVALVASGVDMIGGRCLELLMCARQVWTASGRSFSIDAPSDAFVNDLSRFGLTPDQLANGVAA